MQSVANMWLFYVSVERSWQWNLTDCFRQLCKPRGGFGVNLRQAENVSFFPHCLHRCTLSQTSTHCKHADTLERKRKNTYATPGLLQYVWVGKGRWGKLIFLLREIDVICSALHCLKTIWANSLFSADLAICVCVSQHQTTSIKERNCSIILATATNQLVHLCPSQLLERTRTNSAGTHGTGCLFVQGISPAEWMDPFTFTDKGMKGKMCILYSLIHLSWPFMPFPWAISEGLMAWIQ